MLLRALIVVLALLTLALLALLVPLLRDPSGARRRVLALFRHPGRKPTPPEPDHYYRPYWS
jgi:predicted MFS family arabinose efflux permease